MRNMNKVVCNSFFSRADYREELNSFLRSYRSTPHSSKEAAPTSLLFRTEKHSRFPRLNVKGTSPELVEACANDQRAKSKMKQYSDKTRNAKAHELKSALLARDEKIRSKKSNRFLEQPWTVEGIKGSMISIVEANGRKLTRDASRLKLCTSAALGDRLPEDDSFSFLLPLPETVEPDSSVPQHDQRPRRSERNRRAVEPFQVQHASRGQGLR